MDHQLIDNETTATTTLTTKIEKTDESLIHQKNQDVPREKQSVDPNQAEMNKDKREKISYKIKPVYKINGNTTKEQKCMDEKNR